MSTIKIRENNYKIKQTIRAIFLWEQITERQFEIKSTLDNYLYFYCMLLANNPEFMSWDDFIECLDEDPAILINITKALTKDANLEKLLNPDQDNTDNSSDKKKD